MRNKIILASLLALSFMPFSVGHAKEPLNLRITKIALINYHDSNSYQQDITAVIEQATRYLTTRLAQEKTLPTPKKLAIVLDIDETSLSNYADLLQLDFGGTAAQINANAAKGKDPAIPATLALYHYAKANKVAVFFVTGRREQYRQATQTNLRQAGYENWDGLTFKPHDYQQKSNAPYKIKARAAIERQGYVIVLNIGDQESDLIGGHAEKTFKLPNPYYFLP